MTTLDRIWVAGLPLTPMTLDVAVDDIARASRAREGRVYVLVNAYSATLRRSDDAYAQVLADENMRLLADGASMTKGARLVGVGAIPRSPGPDLVYATAARAATDGLGVFVLGGHEGIARRVCEALTSVYPGLRIAGFETPPMDIWADEDSAAMIRHIRQSGADILLLGVSAPKQEVWARAWSAELGIPVLCIGAAVDFISGAKPRAPLWMRRAGLEWLFRLISEPKRLWKRYLVGNLVFLGDLLRYRGHHR